MTAEVKIGAEGAAFPKIQSILTRSVVAVSMFLTLSTVQFGGPRAAGVETPAFGFLSSAEAQPRARGRVHRGRPAHRPAHRPVHRPVRPAHPVHRPGRRPIHRPPVVVRPIRPIPAVRPWYWGRVVAGVTIGTIIVVTTAGMVPPPPSSDLCWYWTNSSKTRGYWTYCNPPPRP